MAAMTGVLAADFSDFQRAVDDSVVTLRTFEEGAGKVGGTLSRMTDQFSGRKLIQEATFMAEAVERIGGVSKLTEAELARIGNTAADAVLKMQALGMEVPAQLQTLADAARKVPPPLEDIAGGMVTIKASTVDSSGAIGEFSAGLSNADKTLALFGIRIGPQIQALKELGGAAGKTASDIGLIGTAGLTVGAAMAGWQLGRMVADFFSLDEAIGNATASLFGFGDVAAERTGAKMDVLARASQIAGREIRNFDEALKIISNSNAATAESFNTGATRVQQWNKEIAAVRAAGNLPAIDKELKNQTSTLKEISEHYNISTRALEYYTQGLSKSAAAQKAWADEARPRYEAIRVAQEALTEATGHWHATLLTIPPALAKQATEALNMGVAQATVATALQLTTAQVGALDRQMKLNLATMAATEPALGTLDQWIKTNYADTKQWNTEWRFTSEVIADAVIPQLDAVTDKIAEVSAAQDAFVAKSKNAPGGVGVNLEGVQFANLDAAFAQYSARFGGGGQAGMIGGGPPPDFISWAMSMGLATRPGTAIQNTFNIVDTESEIARRVSDEIARQVRSGTLVPAS